MEFGDKMRINDCINPEWGLADTGEDGGLGTQDQVQLFAPEVQRKEKQSNKQMLWVSQYSSPHRRISLRAPTPQGHTELKSSQGLSHFYQV